MTTYATLKSDIQTWLRNDDAEVVAEIPKFILLAEAKIRREVRAREQQTAVNLTITDGSADIPTGFLGALRLILDNTTNWKLTYQAPEVFYGDRDYNASGSNACKYTIEGGKMVFRPLTSESGLLLYNKAFVALSGDADTNYVLTDAYDVYLFTSLIYGAVYLRDPTRRDEYASMSGDAIATFNGSELESLMTSTMAANGSTPGP